MDAERRRSSNPPALDSSPSFIPDDRRRFTFQHYWFDEVIRADWEKLTHALRGQKLQVLEIGAFEGASTTWILDNLMGHADSTLTTIDTFQGGMEHQSADETDEYHLVSLESRFRANVARCEQAGKLKVMKTRSDDALIALRGEGARFDFVYIDASHVAMDVLHDATLSWRMLNVHGTMVFDDFTWKGYMEDFYNPRIGIQSFLQCAMPEIETRRVEGQVWVTRVPNHTAPTPNPDPAVSYWKEDEGLTLQVFTSPDIHT